MPVFSMVASPPNLSTDDDLADDTCESIDWSPLRASGNRPTPAGYNDSPPRFPGNNSRRPGLDIWLGNSGAAGFHSPRRHTRAPEDRSQSHISVSSEDRPHSYISVSSDNPNKELAELRKENMYLKVERDQLRGQITALK